MKNTINGRPHIHSYCWKISKIEPSDLVKQNPTASDTYYYTVVDSNDCGISTGMRYSEIQYLLKYFDVETPDQLIGLCFESEKSSPSQAIQHIIFLEEFGPDYVSPSDSEIYDRVAQALSRMECPDFSDVYRGDIGNIFQPLYQSFSAKPEWMQWLKNRVSELSNYEVTLCEGDVETFPYRIKGPARLSQKSRTRFVLDFFLTKIEYRFRKYEISFQFSLNECLRGSHLHDFL